MIRTRPRRPVVSAMRPRTMGRARGKPRAIGDCGAWEASGRVVAMRGRLAMLASILIAPVTPAAPPPPPCVRYATTAREVGRVPRGLPELSGLAASRLHAGVYWGHNDSGNPLAVIAIHADGTIAAQLAIVGVASTDPEDIAVGPCAAGTTRSCIYLADTGDNLRQRKRLDILRVPEPERLADANVSATVIPVTLPDGPRDIEALAVDPRSTQLYLVSKVFGSLGEVYRVDPDGGAARRIATVAGPSGFDVLTTGMDAHPSGERVLLRTYDAVFELRAPGATSLDRVFAATPVAVTTAVEIGRASCREMGE